MGTTPPMVTSSAGPYHEKYPYQFNPHTRSDVKNKASHIRPNVAPYTIHTASLTELNRLCLI